ncbi:MULTISPECIES: hypothetical protein [Corynebacterium]|uniref:Uncharacterized protein n=2 Tax=Corynebacterium TaxID=1716 RepID=A0ABS9PSP9_9CORY|nr:MULTISPECIES: hypothetical protein [Corynebacterium]MCG7275727.1 hypothetical protein [Corynebacterium singulare]MCQ9677727.1 hypothetical protein [Corynebacterium sp. BF-R-2]QPS59421.1 hypothetical protein I6G51_11160 [Corynebacterium minutissimum]QQA79789.1 hypothetical protein I6H49_01700 [Corynebacterium minutissimum]
METSKRTYAASAAVAMAALLTASLGPVETRAASSEETREVSAAED